MALRMLILPMGLTKSFQRMPRIDQESKKATPESRDSMMPRGVVRFLCSSARTVGTFTKRETSNNRPIPIRRPTVTFALGVLNKLFITFVLLQGAHLDWPG